jgi:PIN domain nuclease of toxin-antitoxin system
LDTCAVIWLANGATLGHGAVAKITHAGLADGIFVSPVSAWEVGILSRPKSGRAVQFLPDPATWFARFMNGPAIKPAPFTADIAIAASHLPGSWHADPADRMLIATARHLGMPIVTRDTKIIAYGALGHVSVIGC